MASEANIHLLIACIKHSTNGKVCRLISFLEVQLAETDADRTTA
jgi:hypothetical protein